MYGKVFRFLTFLVLLSHLVSRLKIVLWKLRFIFLTVPFFKICESLRSVFKIHGESSRTVFLSICQLRLPSLTRLKFLLFIILKNLTLNFAEVIIKLRCDFLSVKIVFFNSLVFCMFFDIFYCKSCWSFWQRYFYSLTTCLVQKYCFFLREIVDYC